MEKDKYYGFPQLEWYRLIFVFHFKTNVQIYFFNFWTKLWLYWIPEIYMSHGVASNCFFLFSGKKLWIYNFEDINYDLASKLKNMCYKTRFIYIYIIFPIYIEIYREYYITLLGPKASLATLMMLYDPTRSWEASAI